MQSARLPIPSVVRAPRPASSCAVAAAGPSSRLGQLQQGCSARNAWNSGCVSARRRRRRKGGAWQAQARVVQSAELSLPSVSGLRRADAARIWPRFKLGFDERGAVGGQGRGAVPVTAGPAVTVREEVGAASWESLAETLAGAEDKPRLGPGERLVHARERVFRAGEEPKLVLYRDSFSWCAYCQRVWLQLEEKRISYRVEKIDMSCYGEKPAWYKSMVPSGLLPAVKLLDGEEEPLTDSLGIMLRLEEKFPDHNPLLPSRDAPEFAAAEEMMRLEKPLVEAWVARMIRTDYQEGAFESVMDAVDSALRRFDGPYFLGSHFSLVDAVFAPFLERIAASMPYWLGIRVRGTDRWGALNPWFDAMDTRPSYVAMKGDDYSIAHNVEVQMGSCNSSEDGAFFRALVDGTHGSWDLPLKPEVTAWGSDDGTGRGGAKVEAAQSLIENHERIVDYAVSDMRNGGDYRSAVDAGFRHVAEALLKGVENVEAPKNMPQEVGAAAVFLRDRVGVPKDMTYPAARQLRAHLQWLASHSGLALAIPQSTLVEPDSSLYSWLYPSKDDLPDDKEMTIWDHLEELRDRVTVSAGAIGAAIVGCFFFSKDLIKILEAPVYSQGVRFLQLSPGEFFFTTLKVSGYSGLMIGSPVLLYEIIAFVLPGLTRSERKFLGPIVLGSSVLFYAGVAFSYIVLTPAALNFFVNYAEGAVESLWSIDQYFEFVLVLLFSTGLAFQVPVIQLLLGQTRLVTGNQMLSVWKYVVVGSVTAAAVLTPSTDPLTQMLLAGPLMGLYLGGALAVKALVPEPEPDT